MLGSHVRNSIEGPAFWNTGVTNTQGTYANAANFGRIPTQAGTPRIFQFGIKYAF